MIKTQIQLPEELYNELKRISKARGWSLAETLRRGAEYMIRVYPSNEKDWTPPSPLSLGEIKVSADKMRELANE